MKTLIHVIIVLLNKLRGKSFSFDNSMELISINHSSTDRYIEYILHNNNLLEGDLVLEGIYKSVFTQPSFKAMGENKIIIVTGNDLDNTFNVHPNIFVTNNTTMKEYVAKASQLLSNRYEESGYLNEITNYFYVKVWNMDDLQNKLIKINSSHTIKSNMRNKSFKNPFKNTHAPSPAGRGEEDITPQPC